MACIHTCKKNTLEEEREIHGAQAALPVQMTRCNTIGSIFAQQGPPCDDMPTPMSVWSMGFTSSGHPWAGPGSPTASLRHRRLRMAGSSPKCPATHRRPQYPTGSAGRGWPAGAAGRGPPPKEPPGEPSGVRGQSSTSERTSGRRRV